MSLFRKKQPDEVPYWAKNMRPEDFERFLKEVERSIRKHGEEPVMHRGEGWWAPKSDPKRQHGLHNLVQMCAHSVPLQWPEIIDEFMTTTFSIKAQEFSDEFKDVERQIKIRLLPLDTRLENMVLIGYPVCDQFHTVIGIDDPQSIRLPNAGLLEKWPYSKSQIYDLALQNMWEQDQPVIRELISEEGSKLIEFRGNFFTASHILLLDRHLKQPAPNGVLVAVPNRDELLYHVIEDKRVVSEVGRMVSIADKFFTDFDGPVSPSLLWWRDGKLTNLPYQLKDGHLDFYPPDEFVEMLNRVVTD